MTTPEPSPEKKALDYAEQQLEVHAVHQRALEARQKLEHQAQTLAELKQKRRVREQHLNDVEMVVIERERAKHPSMSQAQMDKHLKVEFSNDGDIRETRDELVDLAGSIDLVEWEIDLLNQDIKIAVARMQELGGYLNFLAAIKQAETTRKSTQRPDGNPW